MCISLNTKQTNWQKNKQVESSIKKYTHEILRVSIKRYVADSHLFLYSLEKYISKPIT